MSPVYPSKYRILNIYSYRENIGESSHMLLNPIILGLLEVYTVQYAARTVARTNARAKATRSRSKSRSKTRKSKSRRIKSKSKSRSRKR